MPSHGVAEHRREKTESSPPVFVVEAFFFSRRCSAPRARRPGLSAFPALVLPSTEPMEPPMEPPDAPSGKAARAASASAVRRETGAGETEPALPDGDGSAFPFDAPSVSLRVWRKDAPRALSAFAASFAGAGGRTGRGAWSTRSADPGSVTGDAFPESRSRRSRAAAAMCSRDATRCACLSHAKSCRFHPALVGVNVRYKFSLLVRPTLPVEDVPWLSPATPYVSSDDLPPRDPRGDDIWTDTFFRPRAPPASRRNILERRSARGTSTPRARSGGVPSRPSGELKDTAEDVSADVVSILRLSLWPPGASRMFRRAWHGGP